MSLRPAFAHGYAVARAADRAAEGCATIILQIAPDGSVTATEATDVDELPPAVTACMDSAFKGAHFDAPGGAGSTLRFPAKFTWRAPTPTRLVGAAPRSE